MRAPWCDYRIRIALAIFTIERVSANTRLTILNNQSHLECGTMQTVLTCQLHSPPAYSMHWSVDGIYISECSTQVCYRKDGMKSNYNTTVTAARNVFKLYINPVDIFDNKTFKCTNGLPSNALNITTEKVTINKSFTTITNKTVGDNVVFDVTTNCVFHPDAVKLSLESKKVNGGDGFTAFQVNSSIAQIVCSNTENAYCGGNKTSKTNLKFTISTDKNGGEMRQFKLHIVQTLENGTNYTITFENDEIGQLKLPIPGTPSYLMILVAVFVVIIILCIIICCCLKRRIFKMITSQTYGPTKNNNKQTTMENESSGETDVLRVPEGDNDRHSLAADVIEGSNNMMEEDNQIMPDTESSNGTTSKGEKMLLDNLGYGFAQKVKSAAQSNIFTSAKRSNRSRQMLCPAEPRGEDFELVGQALPEGFLSHDIAVDGARHLIFATTTQVEVLQKAKRWYVDGTSKVLRKNDPFTQLYSVHDDGEPKQFPLMFIFMSRRRKQDYNEVFKKVNALTAPASVQGFVMDFEAAAWSAVRTVFPQAQIRGCASHWTRAVFRKVRDLGLSGAYQQDEGPDGIVLMLLGLPLVPAERIKLTFDDLRQRASEPFQPLMEYVESTWISGDWTPADWSVYGQSIQTNNDCEGWHRQLNFRSNGPPAFYSLVDQLHKESQRLPHQMCLVSEKNIEEKTKEEH